MKVQRGLLFMQKNIENDWHYNGNHVKPGEKEAICWWKPQGGDMYRVLYGDLNFADVSPHEIPQE